MCCFIISGKEKEHCGNSKTICTIAESTIYKWFTRFRNGNFDLENQEYFGGPAVIDDDND